MGTYIVVVFFVRSFECLFEIINVTSMVSNCVDEHLKWEKGFRCHR